MDILTHAIMGASLATAVASFRIRWEQSAPAGRRRAPAVAGAVAGVLPDADALIQSGGDALLVLDYHRHFSHALAFVPFGALIAALLLWPFLKRRMGFATLYACSFAAYLAHPLLDACTSYGTHLWLPFSQRREAWNLIAVVDPLFTLLLALPLWFALRRPKSTGADAGRWRSASAYFGLSFQQQRAEGGIRGAGKVRGHLASQLSVKPSMANLVLWRSLYVYDGRVQADAFHLGIATRHYPGESPCCSTPRGRDG
jgi:inner membrane protein